MPRPPQVLLLLAALVVPAGSASTQLVLHTWTGGPGEPYFGQALAALDDVDGDGIPEVAVGDPYGAGFVGRVVVLSGADGTPVFEMLGSVPGAEFGAALAACGDLDGDGLSDLAVGMPLGANGAGRVYILAGADGATLMTLEGVAPDTHFGSSLASAGDVDGDGIPDLIVGAPDETSNRRGAVHLISGADGSEVFVAYGLEKDDRLGVSVAGQADVNGDGVLDLVVGATQTPIKKGYVQVLSGLDGSVLLQSHGDNVGDSFGAAVALLADLTGDGRADVLVGIPGIDLVATDSGAAVVLSGASGSVVQIVGGLAEGAMLGASVASLGDQDGDGREDYAVGTDRLEGGEARVYSGLDGSLITSIEAYPQAPSTLGSGVGVAAIRDLNGDGRKDLLVAGLSRLVSPQPGTVQAVAIKAKPWVDLGQGLVGSSGPAVLEGEGSLMAGSAFNLRISGGPAFGSATLVLGFSAVNAPFKGGTMVPHPDVVLNSLTLDAQGALEVPDFLPLGTAAGTAVVYQVWINDAGAPQGLASTNALAATATP